MYFGILLLLLFASASCSTLDSDNESPGEKRKKSAGFLFMYPRTLIFGKNETVCLVTQEAAHPTKILIDLKVRDKHYTTGHSSETEHTCFKIHVPEQKYKEPHRVSIHLQVQLNGTILSAHNEDPIFAYPNKNHIFIESDRSTYKPGDLVKIRVLTLNNELKPPNQYTIPSIKLVNPGGHVVDVFENIDTNIGLAQIEHQLTEDTTLGKWKIEIEGTSKAFTVQKYVLPRFQVSLNYPKKIYAKGDNLTLSVCAKYSYGRPVKGKALIKISYGELGQEGITKIQKSENGCAFWTFSNKEIHFKDKQVLFVSAVFTEHSSSQMETTNGKIEVVSQPFQLDFKSTRKYFQPGMPYYGTLKLTNSVVNFVNETVEICYNVAVRKPWNIKKSQPCTNFTLTEKPVINFYILPLKDHVVEIILHAKIINRKNDSVSDTISTSYGVKKWYSPTYNYIHVRQDSDKYSKCKAPQQFTVYYTAKSFQEGENVTFYYMIRSRNEIIKLRKITHNVQFKNMNYYSEFENIVGKPDKYVKHGLIDSFQLKFKLDPKILSNAQLLVYYISKKNQEIIVDGLELFVEKCLLNKVDIRWADTQLYPDELASLKVTTEPGSFCGISSIDKANTFLMDAKPLSVNTILQPFIQERASKWSYVPHCVPSTKKPENLESLFDLRRRKRSEIDFFTARSDYDSHDVFSELGVFAITNMKLVNKLCKTRPDSDLYVFQISNTIKSVEYDGMDEDRGISIRSFFPETWLWDLFPIGSSGEFIVHKNLPHSITTWLTNVICVSPNNGPGIAQPIELNIVQPFFVEILSPYSIKRGEILFLKVITFNYYNYSLPISLILGDTYGIELVDADKRTTFCVKANDSFSHTFRIKGTHLGKTNITVLAEIDSSYPGQCGPETIVNKRDVVYRNIIIESEGYTIENIKSMLLCGNDTNSPNNVSWHFDTPSDLVPESGASKIILNADLLGPVAQNLEKLLTVPTGCGEQIMATLAPNVFILRYLHSGINISSINTQRAIRNIKIGYQRILNYVHNDGSFSAFGYHDHSGSMFLTAFIVRTLQQAKRYIFVDENVINKAVKWISQNQLENGCFSAVSHVFQDMGGTSQENSTAALTAYVMISILESNIPIAESIKTNAKYCIRGNHQPDKYTLALTTYALYLLKANNEADQQLEKLLEAATTNKNHIWWNMSGSSSLNVETTAYALMALLQKNTTEYLTRASSIVRWLTTQQNSRGGFTSTQDSAVALDALSRYSNLIRFKHPNLYVEVDAVDEWHNLHVHPSHRLKSTEIILSRKPLDITIAVRGVGCILTQAIYTYNVNRLESSEAFKLAVDLEPVSTIDKCAIAKISPCMSYIGPGIHSNMAVLEVTLPTGYESDRASLYELIDGQDTKLKKFEELDNKIALYFTELNQEQICVPFTIHEKLFVENKMEATATLYDYYKPEMKVFKTYTLGKCKVNKEATHKAHHIWKFGNDSMVAESNITAIL